MNNPGLAVLLAVCFLLTSCLFSTSDDDDNVEEEEDVLEEEEGEEEPLPDVLTFSDGHLELIVDRVWGTFDIVLDGYTYLRGATSAIETGTGGVLNPQTTIHTAYGHSAARRPVTETVTEEGTEIRITHPETELGTMTTILTILRDGKGLTAQMEMRAKTLPDLVSLIPIYVGEAGSGFFLRSDPADLLILQNGSEKIYDHYVELIPGDTPYARGILPMYLSGAPSASSNGNALIYDRTNEEGLNLGFLTFERVAPEVVIGFDAEAAPRQDGRTGFFTFQTRSGFLIPRHEPQGSLVRSELFWMDRFSGRPQESLERYARMLADRLDIPAPRNPGPGWDSWYVYGDRIDRQIIEENLQGLVENFLDYGQKTMQVDLGWERVWGDWTGEARFPEGMDALAADIRDAGLSPEIWMSSFNAMRSSEILTEHPDWEAPVEPLFNLLMLPGARPLDLSRQEVADFNRRIGERVAGWGYGGSKFDFAYYQFMTTALDDPSMTVVEGYRRALSAYREGVGEDHFLINILLMGINYGLVDSMRIGVDTWACWGDVWREGCPDARDTTGSSGMGLRIALKTLARRYYYNNVIWVNHPDQIFFRDHLGLFPQRSWGSVVALSGAVISLGEEVASMSSEAIDTYRRLIPSLGITGVPQDLFEREYPEVWLTPLSGKNPGGYLLGLYSWGNNYDLTRNPRGEIAEGTRRHEISLADLGIAGDFHAFEFWTQSDLGPVENGFVRVDVPARDCRVVVLRPLQDRPYIVAGNRNVSQGGTDLHDPTWKADGLLSWTQDLVAGFAHTVYVAPGGAVSEPQVEIDLGEAQVRPHGELWAVDITTPETGAARVNLRF